MQASDGKQAIDMLYHEACLVEVHAAASNYQASSVWFAVTDNEAHTIKHKVLQACMVLLVCRVCPGP